jgi:hypothetical protein
MKQILKSGLMLTTIVITTLFFSCRKENEQDFLPGKKLSLSKSPVTVKTETPSERNVNPALGVLAGTIFPLDANVTVYLIGDQTFRLYVDEKGNIIQDYYPSGFYTVIISPANSTYGDYVINDIEIVPGSTTDLGLIQL